MSIKNCITKWASTVDLVHWGHLSECGHSLAKNHPHQTGTLTFDTCVQVAHPTREWTAEKRWLYFVIHALFWPGYDVTHLYVKLHTMDLLNDAWHVLLLPLSLFTRASQRRTRKRETIPFPLSFRLWLFFHLRPQFTRTCLLLILMLASHT